VRDIPKNDVLSGRAIRWNLPVCNNNNSEVISGVSATTATNSAMVDVNNNGVLPQPSSSVNDGQS
jgi:hypothetical protein